MNLKDLLNHNANSNLVQIILIKSYGGIILKQKLCYFLFIILLFETRVFAFHHTPHICQPIPQNHWSIAFYIITDNMSILHRPLLHDDIIHHGTIPDDYIPAIKDRAHRFTEGLHAMSNGNIEFNIEFYIREGSVYIIETEDISIQDIFTNNSFFKSIEDTNRYDYIMIIHGDAYYGAGAYLQTLNNTVGTHIGFSIFYPHWLDATYSGNPNNVTPGDLMPVDMFGVTWDFFTYLLLHEFLHALEDQARLINVTFPLIHNDNGLYWDRLYVGIEMGYNGADYIWSTEQRLPYYYAILNGIVPTRSNPHIKWGFSPQVFLRDRTNTPKPNCVPGALNILNPTEKYYGMYYRMCVICENIIESIPLPPLYYEIDSAPTEQHNSQSFIAYIYIILLGGAIIILGVITIFILKIRKSNR